MVTFLAIVAGCFLIIAGFNWFCAAVKADEAPTHRVHKRCPNCLHELESNNICHACGYKLESDND